MASPGKKAFLLRVDPAVWAEIERMAAAELRSVNGQIEYLLREAMAQRAGKAVQLPGPAGAERPRRTSNKK